MKTFTITLGISFLMIPFLSAKESVATVCWSEIIPGETPDLSIIYRYEIGQDTVINQQVYSKLMRDNLLFGAIRENQYQKVFIYFPTTQQEQLLYDFNWENEPAIDSIRLFNNKPYAIKNEEYGKVIQGIGSLNGFCSPLNESRDQSTSLLCYWKNDQLLYLNPDYTNCEGGKSYKSCFGKEYTKWTIAYQAAESAVTMDVQCNANYECGIASFTREFFKEDINTGTLIYCESNTYFNTYKEFQIMKLDVEIGDSILISSLGDCYLDAYSSEWRGDYALVDSIYFQDNRKYIRLDAFILDCNYDGFGYYSPKKPLLFIEGIGTNKGVIPHHREVYLICHETESDFYKDINFDKCEVQERTSIKDILWDGTTQQIGTELHVRFAQPFFGQLFLYDTFGRIQYKDMIKDQMETTFSIEHLSSGTYILKYQSMDGMTSKATKFIIY